MAGSIVPDNSNRPPTREARARRKAARAQRLPAAFIVLLVAAVAGVLWLGYGFLTYASSETGAQPGERTPGGFRRLGESAMTLVRGRPHPTTLEYFATLDNWISGTVTTTSGEREPFGAGEWTCTEGGAESGALRIWRPSLDLTDYDLTFRARATAHAMGWAVRATDARNFEGMRLVAVEPGTSAEARLEHFSRKDGRESPRVRTQLPFTVLERVEYNVTVKVRGAHFAVVVDGQRADAWDDDQLQRGGIGFFSEHGDGAAIRWVQMTERDSTVGRLLGYFSFTVPAWTAK